MSSSSLWTASSQPLVQPPDNWTRMVTMDYGGSSPKANLYWAIHPRWACAVIYGEWYQRGKLIREQVRAAYEFFGEAYARRRDTIWIVDRSAPLDEYIEAGAPVQPSLNIPGAKQDLEAATERLLGAGRILVVRPATDVLQKETSRVVWKPNPDKPFANARDTRVEKDDHLFDCMVYGGGFLALRLDGALEDPTDDMPDAWDPKGWAQAPKLTPMTRSSEPDVGDLVTSILGMG